MAKRELRFKGLDVADETFSRSSEHCSGCVSDTCGTRDCSLEVITLGGSDERILSGGLCPKGNTNDFLRRAPDYVEQYRKILEKHLGKVTVPLEQEAGERVLIPRSLTFMNERGVFYSALYNSLGFDVSISPNSNDEISNLGKLCAHSESCYPVILAHGHAAFLKRKMRPGLDKILLVNALGARDGDEETKFCPYVASGGYVIKGNLRLKNEDVLLPDVWFDDSVHPLHTSVTQDLQRVFGNRFSEEHVRYAVSLAQEKHLDFMSAVHKRGKQIVNNLLKRGEPVFMGIGRGYTVLDDKASSKVHELFALNGLHFVPSFFLPPLEGPIEDVVEHMYWLQGVRMVGDSLRAVQTPGIFPVRESNFNCGPDSFNLLHEARIRNVGNVPGLVMETDGHNSNAQFGTRIRAFNEVRENFDEEKRKVSREGFAVTKPEMDDLGSRIIGVPYMGDSADILVAAFRTVGLEADVMPCRTDKSKAFAQKYVTTNTCRPFAFQVGDHLAWLDSLREKGIDPNETAATFLPKASGPCRFGQYSVVLRNFLDQEGFEGVPIVDPNSTNDYNTSGIPEEQMRVLTPLSFKGIFANDVLQNALLRVRPYEVNSGEADRIYRENHKDLAMFLRINPTIKEVRSFMESADEKFEGVELYDCERKPLVLVNGEIFVRCNEQANQESVLLLEQHGLETVVDPTSGWIDYVNRLAVNDAWSQKRFGDLKKALIKRAYIKHASRQISKPFRKLLAGREFHSPYGFVGALERDGVYGAIGGEGPVTVGAAYAFIKGHLDVDGIYHVGPFGCMQETAATSRVQALIQDQKMKGRSGVSRVIPFMDGVFGETRLPNLDAKIALFAENCKLRKELKD